MKTKPLSLPLPGSAMETAIVFSAQQYSEVKAEQVRLNTLAVWSVCDYLDLMGIASDRHEGDSWNAVVRTCADVADLDVVGLGRLECRPLRPGDRIARVPYEVWAERIGFVFVRVDETRREAAILGFLPAVDSPTIELEHLLSLEHLLDHLDDLRLRPACVQLRRWLEAEFSSAWQPTEELVPFASQHYAFRGSGVASLAASAAEAENTHTHISRAKAIDLSASDRTIFVAFVMEVSPEADTSRWRICVRVHPLQPPESLPSGLHVEVRDAKKDVFLEARARSRDDCMRIQFRAVEGENFSIQLTLSDREVVEYFQI